MKILGLMNIENMSTKAIETIKNAKNVMLQSAKITSYKQILELNENTHTLDALFENEENYEDLYLAGANLAREYELFCYVGHINTNGFIKELKKITSLEYIGCNYDVSYCVFEASKYFEIEDYTVIYANNLPNAYLDTLKGLVITDIYSQNTKEDVLLKLSDYYKADTSCLCFSMGEGKNIKLEDIKNIDVNEGITIVLAPLNLKDKLRYGLGDAVEVISILRGENGCPWDKEQTHNSLRANILEESYEVIEAIEDEDVYALFDELGDVLLQVIFHGEIARQCHEGDILDITTALCQKMISRHPHIFGDVKADSSNEVLKNWEEIKRGEKGQNSVAHSMKEVTKSLSALFKAEKIQKKAALADFDFPNWEEALLKVNEELGEFKAELMGEDKSKIEKEGGDLLFSVINVLRLKKINAELALNSTCKKFIERFEYMEANGGGNFINLTLEQKEKLWENAKNEKN